MAETQTRGAVSAAARPLILVRGFGGLDVDDERASAYQGFNDGSVYPTRRGESYIYEGFVLRALKSPTHRYVDATNVVGYYGDPLGLPPQPTGYSAADTEGTVALDPRMADAVLPGAGAATIWVYRYYDLQPRGLPAFAAGLERLIGLIERASAQHGLDLDGVDVVAHSMGGLIVRAALELMDSPDAPVSDRVHRVVTLGTPHRGIAFQQLPGELLQMVSGVVRAGGELLAFDPGQPPTPLPKGFPPERLLTVVGSDFRSYGVQVARWGNRLASLLGSGPAAENRSDGLVKQAAAQLAGSPRTFVHKCHGGGDSLVTSREAYEIAMRFLHGTHRVALLLEDAEVTRGFDLVGASEFFLGISIRPRGVDFDLFHQSVDAQNCYGPFTDPRLQAGPPYLEPLLRQSYRDGEKEGPSSGWLGPERLVWEGFLDRSAAGPDTGDLVFRFDVYVGERDSFGVGFSDNVVFRKQYYAQLVLPTAADAAPRLLVHTGEQLLRGPLTEALARAEQESAPDGEPLQPPIEVTEARVTDDGWLLAVGGTGFRAVLRVRVTDLEPQ